MIIQRAEKKTDDFMHVDSFLRPQSPNSEGLRPVLAKGRKGKWANYGMRVTAGWSLNILLAPTSMIPTLINLKHFDLLNSPFLRVSPTGQGGCWASSPWGAAALSLCQAQTRTKSVPFAAPLTRLKLPGLSVRIPMKPKGKFKEMNHYRQQIKPWRNK